MDFNIFGIAGYLCTVSTAADATLGEVKMAIQAATGIQAMAQRLVYGSRELGAEGALHDGFLTELDADLDLTLVMRTPDQVNWCMELQQHDHVYNGSWLKSAPEEAKADRDIVLKAVMQDASAFMFASAALRADSQVALAAVTQNGNALRFASPELRADRYIVLAAVRQSGRALGYASQGLRSDKAFVLAAVMQNVHALEWAPTDLRADRDVVLAAMAQNKGAVLFATPELRSKLTSRTSCSIL